MSTSFGKIVMIPMHVDAFQVLGQNGLPVAGPTIDFGKTPWDKGNIEAPFLGKTIVREPFEITGENESVTDDEMVLEKGFHLHWSLPDAFTRTMHLPIVRRQSFISTLGISFPQFDEKLNPLLVSDGLNVWNELIKLKWITPLPKVPVMARVTPKSERAKSLSQVSQLVKTWLAVIDKLLDQPAFPAVPSCWQINIYNDGDDDPDASKWVVSDMLVSPQYQDDQTDSGHRKYHTVMPLDRAPFSKVLGVGPGTVIKGRKKGEKIQHRLQVDAVQPFRYTGQVFDLGEWDRSMDQDNQVEYLTDPLTALGGGDPTFAAFYPNCRNVFGYYDNNEDAQQSIKYEVFGWYREEDLDYFRFFVQDYLATAKADHTLYPYIGLLKAIKEGFSWLIPVAVEKTEFCGKVWDALSNKTGLNETEFGDALWQQMLAKAWIAEGEHSGEYHLSTGLLTDDHSSRLGTRFAEALPGVQAYINSQIEQALGPVEQLRVLCYGTVSLQVASTNLNNPKDDVPKIEAIAIGNTGTEALSAYLANQLSTSHKAELEDYLEALQLFTSQGDKQLDIGASFLQARHDKGFSAEDGGVIWSIRAMSSVAAKADSSHQSAEVNLPYSLAGSLNELNILQAKSDRLQARVTDVRSQIFADWAKYLEATYQSTPADPDVIRTTYITDHWMPQLQELISQHASAQNELARQYEQVALAVLELQYLTAEEVQNWPAFLERLKALPKDGLFRKLASLLASPMINQPEVVEAVNNLLEQADLHRQTFPQGLPQSAQQLLSKGATTWSLQEAQQFAAAAKGILPEEAISLLVQATTKWEMPQQLRYNRLLLQCLSHSLSKQDWFVLQPKAAPRFWTPREPVLLFTGDAAAEPPRWGAGGQGQPDNLLDVNLMELPASWEDIYSNDPTGLTSAISVQIKAIAAQSPTSFAFNDQKDKKPWNPFFLEWEVDVFTPEKEGLTQAYGNTKQYSPDYLTVAGNPSQSRYTLLDKNLDLTPSSALRIDMDKAATYRGYTVITPHAGIQLKDKVRRYLSQLLSKLSLGGFYKEHQIAAENQSVDYLLEHLSSLDFGGWLLEQSAFVNVKKLTGTADLLEWLKTPAHVDLMLEHIPSADRDFKFAFDLLLALVAYEQLQQTPCLSQSLSGFNAGMLTLKQMYQLPVMDLLEEDVDLLPFSADIRRAVLDNNRLTPMGSNPFNPIRAGKMNLSQLNILDNFGRRRKLDFRGNAKPDEQAPTPIASEPLKDNGGAHCQLPPRVVPPARLNFRWLDAGSDVVEMNDHPATSPVCGWVLPNFLDQSLMVYAQSGQALGYIDAEGSWRLFPGHLGPALPEAIENPYLRRMVRWFCEKARVQSDSTTYMDELLQEMELALENIAPENTAQHQGLALLIGRPLALVRTAVSLELRGETPYSQNWAYVKTYGEVAKPEHPYPTNYHFDTVQTPVRIGEHHRLHDGLVLCWEENPDASEINPGSYYVADRYYASQSKTQVAAPVFHLSPAPEAPLYLSVLMDPKAMVHATCGILPAKAIHLPPDQFAPALAAIQVAFFTGPLLSPAGKINLDTPREPGYHWGWTDKQAQSWRTLSSQGHLQKKILARHFPSRVEIIWNQLIKSNWIQPIDLENALVLPADQRQQPATLGPAFQDIEPLIQDILDRTHLNPFLATASFDGPQEIREGWLMLRPESPLK